MSDIFCIYNNKKYEAEIRNHKIEITSIYPADGFVEYVDVVGKVHNDLFIKILNMDDVEIVYEEDVLIKYKDTYFQLFANKIFASAVIDNSYMIWTDSEQLAHEYSFEKKEQFVFIKYITRKEIEAVKIVKKPVLGFQDIEQSEEVLEGKVLDMWLEDVKKSEMDLL